MNHTSEYCVVITTTNDEGHASELASELVAAKLAACVQLQNITSHYEWKGEARKDSEILILIKTRSSLFSRLSDFIKANHPYETPEIIQLPITRGLSSYLNWIHEMTRDPKWEDGTTDGRS